MLKIVLISAACCAPGMASFDEQARKVIDKAIAETEIQADVIVVPVSSVYFSGPYRKIIQELMATQNIGINSAPVILINKEVISYGVPNLYVMKTALIKFVENKSKE